jgi:predicted membrane channel-forming protein YqfA (hemolysin III family)
MNRMKRWMPTAVVLLAVAAMLFHGPIAQLDHYHDFADRRALFGVTNAGDVFSNIGFAIVALWGFWSLRDVHHHPRLEAAWPGYRVFLIAILLTAFGSSFYHLAPDNDRLLWDRLPIALACVGLLAAVRAETHDSPQPQWLLPALIIAAVLSVVWWSVTEVAGAGDLRPYLLIQGAPLILIPLWHGLHGSPRTDRMAFGIAILLYVVAKAAEMSDREVFDALGFVSGHTIKHLLAAAAAAVLTANIVWRTRAAQHSGPFDQHFVGLR